MKNIYSFLYLLGLFFAQPTPTHSVGFFKKTSIESQIKKVIHETDPHINIGIKIIDLDKDQVLFEQNGERYFYPASLTKILTCLAALKKLGAAYQFQTNLYRQGADWYVEFGADPTLTLNNLRDLFHAIKSHISTGKIEGNLYVVQRSKANLPLLIDGWTLGSSQFCFGAPVSSIIINTNGLRFNLVSEDKKSTQVSFASDQISYPISNKTYVGSCTDLTKIERHHLSLGETLNLEGCVSEKILPLKMCLPIGTENFKTYVEKNIKLALEKEGLHLFGKLIFAQERSAKAVLVNSWASDYLIDILIKGMKESDNLVLNAILLAVLEDHPTPLRKWDDAGKQLAKILEEELHSDLSGANLTDGAGLSYLNLISPSQILQLLVNGLSDKAISEDFLRTLAVPGEEGTLKGRLNDIKGVKIIAKTGALTSVSGLAGFVLKNNKPKFAFVIMINGVAGGLSKYNKLEENIVRILSDHS
ncbi:MAG: D-alanyl-D-alanine carboxypeptidase/D-alanyl-D-alanine-endopeptidase [Alphaproteobacteria bacterium]